VCMSLQDRHLVCVTVSDASRLVRSLEKADKSDYIFLLEVSRFDGLWFLSAVLVQAL